MDWHERRLTKRVSRGQEEAKKTSLLAPIAAAKYRYDIESASSGSDDQVVGESRVTISLISLASTAWWWQKTL